MRQTTPAKQTTNAARRSNLRPLAHDLARTRSASWRFGLCVLLLLFVSACDGDENANDNEPRPPEVLYKHRLLPPLPAARELASTIGFDLIATDDGATLVYGPAFQHGGGLSALFMSPEGAIVGGEVELLAGVTLPGSRAQLRTPWTAVEVSAAMGAGRLGVAWVESFDRRRTIRRGIGSVTNTGGPEIEFGAVQTLSETAAEPEIGRSIGMVYGADDSDAFSAMYPAGNCPSDFESCIEMRFSSFGIGAQTRSRGPAIAIPSPCESPLRGLLRTSDGFDYAVCSSARGTPEVSVFTIDYEPEYARAESLFAGCHGRELGLLAASKDGTHTDFSRRTLLANCDGEISAAIIGGEELAQIDDEPNLDCVGDDLRWSLEDGTEEHTAVWRVPSSHLAGLLPYSLQGARDGVDRARAVWTGKALLVAYPQNHTLVTRRYVCIRGSLYHADGRGRVSARAPIAIGTPGEIAESTTSNEVETP